LTVFVLSSKFEPEAQSSTFIAPAGELPRCSLQARYHRSSSQAHDSWAPPAAPLPANFQQLERDEVTRRVRELKVLLEERLGKQREELFRLGLIAAN